MLANLRALFGVIVDIVLLRRGAESLPASVVLLVCVVSLQLGAEFWIRSMAPTAPASLPIQLLVSAGVTLLCFRLAAILSHKRERFLQIVTGEFGAALLFTPVLLPIVNELMPYIQNTDKSQQAPFGLSMLGAVLGLWLLVVQVRIVRAGLEWPWAGAIVFYFGQLLAGALAYTLIFGIPPAPT
jgi:hypothetical protein